LAVCGRGGLSPQTASAGLAAVGTYI
jgi:hypothetical protein